MSQIDGRPTRAQLRAAPKVLLHDHLDGGLRPATIIDCAARIGYGDLPTDDPDELRNWFSRASDSGSLPTYLARFRHTYGVLQTRETLVRAARENVEDLAADGIIYAETRFAPELHQRRGLTLAGALDAVVAGTREGIQQVAGTGHRIDVRVIVCAMRHLDSVAECGRLVSEWQQPSVVGFDLGGPELGYPASAFRDLFVQLRSKGVYLTIHAGEGDGIESIRQAAIDCGAVRLGHGVRITEDIRGDQLGPVAQYMHDNGVVLECCPSSNVHTGAVPTLRDHPALALSRAGFAVTINTDNRLLSQTTLSEEFARLAEDQDLTWADAARLTATAARGAFLAPDERQELCHLVKMSWSRYDNGPTT